ncbi:MAG TPA: SDR family oxidoreductase [Kofleriaceae bacterium]|nr:SDR family oxidoreductase [Kofleriaceae bacterium]
MTEKPVCVVVGVGPGNGAAFARRFAREGYRVALLARGRELTDALARELEGARAYTCDVSDAAAIDATFDAIERELGAPAVVIYNAGSGVFGGFEEVSPADFEKAWRVNALGLYLVARRVAPAMREAGRGALIIVGATASRRGVPRTAAFAPAKAAQRSLAESLARTLWPAGVHVALIIIDGVVDLPRTRAFMKDKPDSFFVKPEDVAETAAHLVHQGRSAWSFEVEARPFGESW